ELRTEAILKVALQHTLLDQDRFMCRVGFIVDVERSTPVRNRSIIDNGAKLGCDLLAHKPRKSGSPFAIEIRLESMADGFMQKDSRPSWPEHNFHRTRGRILCAELEYGLTRALGRQRRRTQVTRE